MCSDESGECLPSLPTYLVIWIWYTIQIPIDSSNPQVIRNHVTFKCIFRVRSLDFGLLSNSFNISGTFKKITYYWRKIQSQLQDCPSLCLQHTKINRSTVNLQVPAKLTKKHTVWASGAARQAFFSVLLRY